MAHAYLKCSRRNVGSLIESLACKKQQPAFQEVHQPLKWHSNLDFMYAHTKWVGLTFYIDDTTKLPSYNKIMIILIQCDGRGSGPPQ